MQRKAFSYLRFSNKEQRSGDSVRRQLALREAYCEKHKVTLDTSLRLEDLGVSAFKGRHRKRGALAGFLSAIDSGQVPEGSILLIESLDRLSREEVGEQLELFLSILRRGINIVTLSPEEEFTRKSINDITKILTAIIIMSRAHEESAMKSKRVSAAWQNKQSNASKAKLTKKCPAWLSLSQDRQSWEVIEPAAKIVRRIFEMSASGMGSIAITQRLTSEGVPGIGRTKAWSDGYVRLILDSRSVIGEYQPCKAVGTNYRVPRGKPVPGYYPAIVSEELFYRAKSSIQNRTNSDGRHGAVVANLFPGILKDARDGGSMTIKDADGKGRRMFLSYRANQNHPGTVRIRIPCSAVERAIMLWASELRLEDMVPPSDNSNTVKDSLRKSNDKLADIEHRLSLLKQRAKSGGNVETVLDLIQELETERNQCRAEVESLKQTQALPEADSLQRAMSVMRKLETAQSQELIDLRLHLRTQIREMIDHIYMLPYRHPGGRFAHLQIVMRNGTVHNAIAMEVKGRMIDGAWRLLPPLQEADLSKPYPWPVESENIIRLVNSGKAPLAGKKVKTRRA